MDFRSPTTQMLREYLTLAINIYFHNFSNWLFVIHRTIQYIALLQHY